MVRSLLQFALDNPMLVIIMALALVGAGGYAFLNINVEAYPDPAPAIIEVIAQFPGASAEEVERQVTIPIEVALAGMPGLKYTRSKSLFGLSHLRNQFEYGIDYYKARQEVINRLQFLQQLPPGVNPQISPVTPTGELVRYTIRNPTDLLGQPVYTLEDLKSLQDWTLQRQFRRVPRIADVSAFGGAVKRYEVQPDPERLKRYGITLAQLQNAVAASNANVGGDYLVQGPNAFNVRGVGLIGDGQDPMQANVVVSAPSAGAQLHPMKAAAYLRAEEQRRLRAIRTLVVATVNNVPVHVEDLVDGGPLATAVDTGMRGVIITHQTRLGRVSLSSPVPDSDGKPIRDSNGEIVWRDEEEKIQGVVMMRKGEETLAALQAVHDRIDELNQPDGGLLPGAQLDLHFDLTGLINVTTETVRENLFVGIVLVTVILLMFLSNVRSALIVAINIPLALLFAFSVLFLRGKSANLLSIGAVDFGIIVDSSVIMVENIYRHISSGENAELPLKERILCACHEVERPLFFSTAVMVCAFIPLFTMKGPEGQIFGPMADTYAFALAGALLLALTIAPVLCLYFFRHLVPRPENAFVRWVKNSYLKQLEFCIRFRGLTLTLFAVMIGVTASLLPSLGREFMPELEEGNLYIRGTFPVNVALDEVSARVRAARGLMRKYPEIKLVASQVGRPDDGTDPTGFYNAEFSLPLRPEKEWPRVNSRSGISAWLWGTERPRTKLQLVQEMSDDLARSIPGVDWNFSQYIRDNVMESLSGVKGDNSIKIVGPDLGELERLAQEAARRISAVEGIAQVAVFRVLGQPSLELRVDRNKCNQWGVSVADVEGVIQCAVGGKAVTQMVEGEKTFDITIRWPAELRSDLQSILNIPVDITNHIVTPGYVPTMLQTPLSGGGVGISAVGSNVAMPSVFGSVSNANANNFGASPRRRLGDLVTPLDSQGHPDPQGQFIRSGASTIYREQGSRLIAVKFSVRGRDLAGAVAEAQRSTATLFRPPYRTEWSGEFQEMEEAERRLLVWIPIALTLICLLLYIAFRSTLDVLTIFTNVIALSLGGLWGLLLTGTNFSISAAVGFISIFGVAIMDGLLSISYFNRLRFQRVPLNDAIMQGAAVRVRPMMMTALTAVFGLLPAALSTRIGAQTQRPLAIVVVGGMITALLMNRYLMPVLYSFYGDRDPPASAGQLAH